MLLLDLDETLVHSVSLTEKHQVVIKIKVDGDENNILKVTY